MTRRSPQLKSTIRILIPAAGVLAIGVFILWRAAEDADRARIASAERGALATARRIQAALSDRRLILALPESVRFEIAEGRLVIPDRIGWIDEAAEVRRDLPWAVEEGRNAAVRLEFGDGRPEQAGEVLAAARAQLEAADPKALPAVLLPLAWNFHRRGMVAERDGIVDELRRSSIELAAERTSLLLLLVECSRPLESSWRDVVARLPEREARAVIARLGTNPNAAELGFDAAAWNAELEAVSKARAQLALVSTRVASLSSATTPQLDVIGDEWLVYVPESTGRGSGAVIAPRALIDAARAADQENGIEWDARVEFTKTPPEGAVLAMNGVAVLPDETTSAFLRSGSWLPGIVLAALLVFLAIGVTAIVRSARSEALAAATRADFLVGITHELKTPLASIRLLAEMLESGRVPTTEKRLEYHRLLSAESGRLSMLIDNVLDLGRMERGERGYDFRDDDVVEVAAEAVVLFEPIAQREELVVETEFATGLPAVRLDHGAVVQALLSLLDNARKYGASGKRIIVSAAKSDRGVALSVRDFGPGIDAAERLTIFDRFVRGETAKRGAAGGVGLGLYLVREIVIAHGGHVEARAPREGPGAELVIELPAEGRSDAS